MIITDKYGELELRYNGVLSNNELILPDDIYHWWNSLSDNTLEAILIYEYLVSDYSAEDNVSYKIIMSPRDVDNVPALIDKPVYLDINEKIVDGCKVHTVNLNKEIKVTDDIVFLVNVSECDPVFRKQGLVIIQGLDFKKD
ncbi:MAG: hypothetical protein BZ134_02425 [Methanosphaera sp. SHI1033]|nr:MAG: hypothetical protein BZ134_02425 [Methanosphaera sp. SHI1033]